MMRHRSLNFEAGHGPTILFMADSSRNFEILPVDDSLHLSFTFVYEKR